MEVQETKKRNRRTSLVLNLSVNIRYKPNGVPQKELENMLRAVIQKAFGMGEITGNTDAECEPLGTEVRRVDPKIKRWVFDGELDGSKKDLDDVMDDCAVLLNKSYATDILGEVLFEGDDGKHYVITTEALVGEANPNYLKDALERAKEED